ncbi:MAG: hypothetical protein U5L05_01200 [Rubrivivax sp.]|nr:hypothetical protein [Rubrivivax sp.]
MRADIVEQPAPGQALAVDWVDMHNAAEVRHVHGRPLPAVGAGRQPMVKTADGFAERRQLQRLRLGRISRYPGQLLRGSK